MKQVIFYNNSVSDQEMHYLLERLNVLILWYEMKANI